MSVVDFSTALFLAALPYRQEFFAQAGWKKAPLPGTAGFRFFLNENFTRIEIQAAESLAEEITANTQSPYTPPFRPQRQGHISWWDADYPLDLRRIFDPPPILFYALYGGRFPKNGAVLEAVVGTRRPHRICQKAVSHWLGRLQKTAISKKCDLWIVSGLALGVDRLAHKAALERGLGSIAVLGSGLGYAGPRSNLDLLSFALQKKIPLLLLTEFPPNMPGSRWSFPRRNRIIAGLSQRTAVIQAPAKSGSMITARYALEEGREVAAFDHELLAFPGANEGARSLLADGAEAICLPSEKQGIRQSWEASEALKLHWQDNLFLQNSLSLENPTSSSF